MTCNATCANDGTCSFNGTCICARCYMGSNCDISVNVIKFSLTFAMHYDIRQTSTGSGFNPVKFAYTFAIAFLLLLSLVNNILCLQTFFTHTIRLTNCGVFQILYCCIGLMTLVGMQLRMLTMLEFDALIQSYAYRYVACNIIPGLVIIFVDMCMWLSVLLAIELVLLECFNLNLYRSRRFAVISSVICFLVVGGSHLHEIITRNPLPDPDEPSSYMCKFIYPLPLDIIDRVLRAGHVIIPCGIHFLTSMCILSSMTRRVLFVYNREDYFRVFINECVRCKHFFVPPCFIVLSNLPHLIVHLQDVCEDARDTALLRTHNAFNMLVYLPPAMTFFIYIYPSKSYMLKFKTTFFARRFGKPSAPLIKAKLSVPSTDAFLSDNVQSVP